MFPVASQLSLVESENPVAGSLRQVDLPRIEGAVREILLALGENPDREGLEDTPRRVARAYRDLCSGLGEDAGVHLGRQFGHPDQSRGDLVMVRDVEFHSLCEHHLLPFTGRAHVAYLPAGGRVVGLSKLARTVDVYARRPQMQERLTSQVADALVEHLAPLGVAVVVEGKHACMSMRGAAKGCADMLTTSFRGVLEQDLTRQSQVVNLMLAGGR
jgi:GTP cyclohydrolase I